MKKNLILVRTPLQVYIINKLIESKEIVGDCYVIYTNQNPNSLRCKIRSDSKCTIREYSINDFRRFSLVNKIFQIANFSKILHSSAFDRVYCASIDYLPFRYIITNLIYAEIITFDDGLGNYKNDSIFFKDSINIYEILIERLLNISKMTFIKSKSTRHFHIINDLKFNSHESCCKNFSHLNIGVKREVQKQTSIFIGQEWHHYKKSEEKLIISKIMKMFEDDKIDLYILHPKEIDYTVANKISLNIVKLNGICEDFIDLMSRNSEQKLVVYSILSTTPFILQLLPNVELRILVSNEDSKFEIMKLLDLSKCQIIKI